MQRRLEPLYLCRISRSVDPLGQAFRWITDHNINDRRPIKSVYIIDKLEAVVRILKNPNNLEISKMAEDRSSLKRSSHFLSIFSCLTPSPFCCFSFWEEVFQRFFYIVFLCKISWPHPTPGDYDMNKLSSVLPEGASIQVSAFLANDFEKIFFKCQPIL